MGAYAFRAARRGLAPSLLRGDRRAKAISEAAYRRELADPRTLLVGPPSRWEKTARKRAPQACALLDGLRPLPWSVRRGTLEAVARQAIDTRCDLAVVDVERWLAEVRG